MDIDALVREVIDLRKTLDEAVRDIERWTRQQPAPVYCPPAPFVPTLEDFAAIMPDYSAQFADSFAATKADMTRWKNNDKDDDGA